METAGKPKKTADRLDAIEEAQKLIIHKVNDIGNMVTMVSLFAIAAAAYYAVKIIAFIMGLF